MRRGFTISLVIVFFAVVWAYGGRGNVTADWGGIAKIVAGILAAGIALVMVALGMGYYSLSGRLGRLVAAKRYAGAIALAESSSSPLDTVAQINLVAAYYFSNQVERARSVMALIEPSEHAAVRAVVEDWRKRLAATE